MDFRLTDEQNLMIEAARKVGDRFGTEYWRKQDAAKQFPKEFWLAVCEAGLCGAALPTAVGGAGLGMLELALVVETLAACGGGATVGQLFMINPIFGGVALSKFGTPAMKAELLPKIVSGEINCCMALTEPDAGTNTLELRSYAEADGDGWRLNGRKIWITGVPDAAKMLVVARTKKLAECKSRSDGLSMFMVDVERQGLTHTAIDKVGTRTLASSSVFFDDVRVRADELVGTLHRGWHELLDVLNTERIVTTAALAGTGTLAIRLAVQYANERKVFGDKPVSSYQGLQFPLAQCHVEVEAAKLLNLKAATNCDMGLPYGSEANAAKLLAAQAVARATERAMQTMGGMGYASEFHVERLWRDARLFRFAPVSEEMILNYVANHDLGMPRSY
ncbi:acyl-CoA dehydrogenase [Variovorax paradoxus]|uniref:acyl-CoA dehydrogenase family protein n=1 Tax=Comamonadaceae TaxID=80864 RepID=UPI00056F9F84|nr:acyl-CoA dehydrogenase family protein [Xenophilus azovorans]KPU99430.1 acyl-CoA dehydrogenase [Variovorax paradoxus]MBN8746437.1 acyl-CoA/acyl-ACP dehydrogenase [Variovorax sp.]VTY37036.1 Acyl-CoA dehydrogenase fadE12 [Xylophilus ampelinus]KPV02160.1 acyl-CoA dehydrogenase [Variovorax paradoxus]KPV08707.1 acyl-CoA dehydrogenase [Variovorax paradoxus]